MIKTFSPVSIRRAALLLGTAVLTGGFASPAAAQGGLKPINPFPLDMQEKVYTKPAKTQDISAAQISGGNYYQPTQTVVSQKVNELNGELSTLHGKVSSISTELNRLQKQNEDKSAKYYAAVATINTQLQAGTTPGNPRLTKRLQEAESTLESFSGDIGALNELSKQMSSTTSSANFLLEATRAAYGISGAVEEDHVQLTMLEDSVNNLLLLVERVSNNITDDISRTTGYVSSERSNLQPLSLAVANGDLYGKSLSNRPFSNAAYFGGAPVAGAQQPSAMQGNMMLMPSASVSGPRLLAKIRFDRPDVDYEQPVYVAVNEAMQRYPDARFELVAVHPNKGNAAEVAIESTKARRNAEKVLRTLTGMGLPLNKVDLSYSESAEATSSEVHVFIR
ncbi:MAG: hypothetical protein ACT4OY_03205 [Alphaproteobacteria bacterium]